MKVNRLREIIADKPEKKKPCATFPEYDRSAGGKESHNHKKQCHCLRKQHFKESFGKGSQRIFSLNGTTKNQCGTVRALYLLTIKLD